MGLWTLIRLALVALAVWFLYRTLKRWIGGGQSPKQKTVKRYPGEVIDEMVQDPQCGTYLPRQEAITAFIRGQEHYFCSTECRDAFKAGKPPENNDDQA